MTWFVASLVMSIRIKSGVQFELPVYENFVLMEGESSDVALKKAIAIGKKEELINDDLELDGLPARMCFEGIRKLINVSNPEPLDLDGDQPVSGTELTYSQYLIQGEEALKSLVNGDEVELKYIE
ncbi:DUF4288 domain-containing protein [Parachitinimonas caeni]|uniref:DUF4288 domain-containing protein n=1 Tax=Parachitinimonas caeni TaxID=3031301 RepID=A0ABT7DZ26_9NEIS|nr:hypothetical protein [Parachitinimonas caeni]MDK2125313.1 hypothetical protein [Parachitinimonas caeni]